MNRNGKENGEAALFEKAAAFATIAHSGQNRKGKDKPYILHPMEAAAIVGRCLDGLPEKNKSARKLRGEKDELLAAAVLHDVVEDAGVTREQLVKLFGVKVADLVMAESEDKQKGKPEAETWKERKEKTIEKLGEKSTEAKLLCLGDKLSNLREIATDYAVSGSVLWERFNQKDPEMHAKYYRGILGILEKDEALKGLPELREYRRLVDEVFGGRE